MSDGEAASSSAAHEGWVPAEGETVRVLKMGGAAGKVVSASGRSGGKISVRVGALTIELRLSDVAPASGPAVAQQVGAARAGSSAGSGDRIIKSRRGSSSTVGTSAGSLKDAAKQLRARGSLTSSSSGSDAEESFAVGQAVTIQTSRNTVDVRGLPSADAAAEVQAAVLSAPPGDILFVVHGVGRGLVRAAVLAQLKKVSRVRKYEEEEGSKGGCTVVYIK